MRSDLLLILEELEKEYLLLNQAINECVNDGDFLSAHYYSEANQALNRQLQILYPMLETGADEINWIRRTIHQEETLLNLPGQSLLTGRKEEIQLRIDYLKSVLEGLAKNTGEKRNDDQQILEYLDQLHHKQISKISLLLRKTDQICLDLTLENQALKIVLGHLIKEEPRFQLANVTLNELRQIGFEEIEDQFQLQIREYSKAHYLPVLETLSREYYGIYYYDRLDPFSDMIITQ